MKLIIKEEKYDLSWKEHDVKMRVDGEMGTYPSYAKRVGNLVVNIDPEVFNNGEFGYTVYYTPHTGKAGFKKAESGFMNSSEAMDYADTYIFGASDFVDPFWESKLRRNRSTKRMNEMTSDEQKDKLKQLKLDVRDMLSKVNFKPIPEATMAMYETDKKGFREALKNWAIECDNRGYNSWTTNKIYVGSLDGKAPVLYKFNQAYSLIMLTTGNGTIVRIAKSGQTRLDPPWTKYDAVETLYSWLKEYLDQ